MKKILLTMILILGLAGCTSTNSSSSDVKQETSGKIIFRSGWTDNLDPAGLTDVISKYTGTKFEAQMGPLENGLDKLMLDLASETPMNIVKVMDNEWPTIYSNKLALDLKPYLEKYGPNIMKNTRPEAWDMVTDPKTGAINAIPFYQGTEEIFNVTMYRKDILKKEGLEVPKTTDDVVDTVCKLADKGYQTPWAINWGSVIYDYGLVQSFGVGYDWNVADDGKLVYRGQDPRFLEFLKMTNKMYECGGYGKDFETITQEDRNSRFVNGDAVFLTAPKWEADSQNEALELKNQSWDQVVDVLGMIEGPNGEKNAEMTGGGAEQILFIPVYMEKYAVETIKFLDKMASEDWQIKLLGEEGKNFKYDENGVPYKIPGVDEYYEGADYYDFGVAEKWRTDSYNAAKKARFKMVEDGEKVLPGELAEYKYSKYEKYGVQNPIGPAILLEKWNEQETCASEKVTEFAALYTVGQKTEKDFKALGEDLDNTCKMQSVTKEVNDWYTKFKK